MIQRSKKTAATTLLLLSGGMDSAALANLRKPDLTLFIDYGQRPAEAERRAARAVAAELGLRHSELQVDLSPVGGGLMSGSSTPAEWPSPEWWPFRNQLLVSCAAAWSISQLEGVSYNAAGGVQILVASVVTDRTRHLDGSPAFYQALNELLQVQEGNVSVLAPTIDFTTDELVESSQISDSVLAWTHSCHVANIPCYECPGCYKRTDVLARLGRL